jgi:hypothetical protein
VRDVARRDRTRSKTYFFRKAKNQKSKDREKENATFPEILRLRKTDRGSKDVASLSIRVVLSKKSGRASYRNPGHL